MPLVVNVGGAPRGVATIDHSYDPELELCERFFAESRHFTYTETVRLSRAFSVSAREVRNWRYGKEHPRVTIMYKVLRWIEDGKPFHMLKPSEDVIAVS